MHVTSKKLPHGQAEMTITMTPEEYHPFLLRAAAAISERLTIPGFRPGKAPYATVMEKIGEAKLWEEALEPAVRKTYAQGLQDTGLISIGSPRISVVTLAPGNSVVYRATISLLPEVSLADLRGIKVARKVPTVSEAEITRTIDDLRKMRRTEKLVSRPAGANDKVEIKLDTFLDNVAVDQGATNRLPLVLGEGRFLPGFEQHVIGLSADQEKSFTLTMPDNYHNRAVAGKGVEFRVKMFAVYELTLPELNDDFAKQLGNFASVAELRDKIKGSLLEEAAKRENERLEEAILEAVTAKSKFSDIPDLLVTTETKNMAAELEQTIKHQGGNFEDYLTHLKKTRAQLLLDLTPTALKRIKAALITRSIANQQQVTVADPEVDTAIQQEFSAHEQEPEHTERTKSPEFRAYVRNILASRKVMEYLNKTVAPEAETK